MKFKKVAKVLLSCMMAGALFTGCGGSSGGSGGDKPASEAPSVKLGMITHLNATEQKMDEILANITEKTGVNVSRYAVTYYENLSLMNMGIQSGSVDQVSLYKSVADYVIANNDKFALVTDDPTLKTLSDSFCFAVRKDDTALKNELDRVIGEMKADGSLDKLVNEYITAVDKGQAPPKVDIPMIDGADIIKVGVTGDLPPLDYVNAEGQPAGFNTALLAEIGKRLGTNIEIIDIDSGARATALTAKNIDVIFWAIIPNGDHMPADLDKPENVEFSAPYFRDDITHLKLNK